MFFSELIIVRDVGRSSDEDGFQGRLQGRSSTVCVHVCQYVGVATLIGFRPVMLAARTYSLVAACTYSLLRVSAMPVETGCPAEVMVSCS